MVQWLRLCAPNAGNPGLIPGQGSTEMENVIAWLANLKEISWLFAPGNIASLPISLTDSNLPLFYLAKCFLVVSIP